MNLTFIFQSPPNSSGTKKIGEKVSWFSLGISWNKLDLEQGVSV
jgi:hypothetical protein